MIITPKEEAECDWMDYMYHYKLQKTPPGNLYPSTLISSLKY